MLSEGTIVEKSITKTKIVPLVLPIFAQFSFFLLRHFLNFCGSFFNSGISLSFGINIFLNKGRKSLCACMKICVL